MIKHLWRSFVFWVRPSRARLITQKVHTDFGSMYIHIELDGKGRPVGGSISHPGKNPTAQISLLVQELSIGLNQALDIGANDGR